MRSHLMILLAVAVATAGGQVRITSTQKLPLPADRLWMAPQFSPDGSTIFVTTAGYKGIWRYTRADGSLRQITADAGAGYGFSVSDDGSRLAYRRTDANDTPDRRVQEIVTVDLLSGEEEVLASGRDLALPAFAGDRVLHASVDRLKNDPAAVRPDAGTRVLGIEETKIALLRNGRPVLLDPWPGGSYIWPSLSPDGSRLVAYEMARGTFVCDLDGRVLASFGRMDAPSWMRSGRWIVTMDQKDDGHAITASDLVCISPDGRSRVRLTDTPAIELMPVCSPVADQILVCTPRGEVYVLGYEEGRP